MGVLRRLASPGCASRLPSCGIVAQTPVGDRIAARVPHAKCCPLCGDVETHSHAVSPCPHLAVASGLVSRLLPKPEVNGVARSVTDLVLHHVPLSLSSAAGLVFWSAISVNWSICCAASLNGLARVPEAVFLRKWLEGLRSWSGASPRYLPESERVLFERALRSRVEGAPLVHPRVLNPGLPLQGALPVIPSFNPGTPRLKRNAATLRARFVLAVEPLLLAGLVAVYLDGSSELVHGVWIGGFRVCFDAGLGFSSPLPVHDPQRNIRADLWAALWALRRHQPGVREVFCTDCNLVFLGVRGGAIRLKRPGWRNASGPVSHVDIWEEVLGLCLRFVGKCAGSRYQHTMGSPKTRTPTPSPTRAGWTALFICFLWRRVGLRGPLTRTRVFARHMIWLRTIPLWSRWRGWSPWRTALTTTRTWTGGGMGKGRYRGRDPAPPLLCTRGTFGPQCRCRWAPRRCPAWRATP